MTVVPGEPSTKRRGWWKENRTNVIAFSLIVTPILGMVLYGSWLALYFGSPDKVLGAWTLTGPRGTAEVTDYQILGVRAVGKFTSAQTVLGRRLVSVDLGSREELGRGYLETYDHVLGASGEVLWILKAEDGLEAWDGRTMKALLGVQALIDRNPGLKGRLPGPSTNDFAFDPKRGTVVLTTLDGMQYLVHPGTWAAEALEPERPAPGEGLLQTCEHVRVELDGTDRFYQLAGGEMRHLQTYLGLVDVDRPWQDGFPNGSLLCRGTDQDRPFSVIDFHSLLVLHRRTLDPSSPDVLTLLGPKGKVRWSVELPARLRATGAGMAPQVFAERSALRVAGTEGDSLVIDFGSGTILKR